jgi:GTPase SAR1 family protein
MFHARGMLVGCAGAGKTSLLKKLKMRESGDREQPAETTIGLDVYEDLFVIESGTLKGLLVLI